jgi:excisionase family DNA binding protein
MDKIKFKGQWINTEEAAQYLGVTTRTIANYRERGMIPFSQVGRIIRYRKEDLEGFLMEHYVQPYNYGRTKNES